MNSGRKKAVVVGAGFGGLKAAQALAKLPIDVTIVDRRNHHIFQPLLYQVATAGLSPSDIAAPVRSLFSHRRNVEVLLDEVKGFDLDRRIVYLTDAQLAYDYLIVAAGASHAYFGHDEWAAYAPGLKTIEDATEIRRRILLAFELAERESAAGQPHMPLNMFVVGGGPTGVELAGTLAEISRHAFRNDFRTINPRNTRIVLVEGGPRVLPSYSEDLSKSAEKQLAKLGVEVWTQTRITNIEPGAIFAGDRRIPSAVTIWAAGVAASPLGKMLGAKTDHAGRVEVEKDLSIAGHSDVFVIGDLAALKDEKGNPLPGVAPVAMQQGTFAAEIVSRDLENKPRTNFHYSDKGSLATIGRNSAIAEFGKLHISGYFAWLAWLFIHIFFLVGFRNRVLVMIQWAWSYFTYSRGARLIVGSTNLPGWMEAPSKAKLGGWPGVHAAAESRDEVTSNASR